MTTLSIWRDSSDSTNKIEFDARSVLLLNISTKSQKINASDLLLLNFFQINFFKYSSWMLSSETQITPILYQLSETTSSGT